MANLIKLERTTSDERTKKYQEMAQRDFSKHVIRHRDNRSWVCFKKHKDGGWDSQHWFEAIVLYGGTLLVNGDIDLMHFAYYGKYQNPEEVLRWMGRSRDVGYYVAQKAQIGMTAPQNGDGLIETLDVEIWMDEALDSIEQELGHKIDVSKEVDLDALPAPEWLRETIQQVAEYGLDSIQSGDINSDAWDAGVMQWGRAPSTRLIYAHEALKKLVSLLDEESAATAVQQKEV